MSSPGKTVSSESEDLAPIVEPLALDFPSLSEDQDSFCPISIQKPSADHPSKENIKQTAIPDRVIYKAYRFFRR